MRDNFASPPPEGEMPPSLADLALAGLVRRHPAGAHGLAAAMREAVEIGWHVGRLRGRLE